MTTPCDTNTDAANAGTTPRPVRHIRSTPLTARRTPLRRAVRLPAHPRRHPVSITDTDNHFLSAALDLAGHGMHVFPLTPDAKTPALRRNWEGRATTDPARIERCWRSGPFNIGIACGPSRLYVLDLDTPKPDTPAPEPPFDQPGITTGADALAHLATLSAAPLPFDTLTALTGRSGQHLYFRQPDGARLRNTAGRLGYLIDTRGTGGYVVGPGSIVNGNPYRIIHEAEPASLPAWISRLIDPPKRRAPSGPPTRHRTPGRYAEVVLRGELDKVLSAKPGTRNDTLNQVAFTLGTHIARGTLPAPVVEHALNNVAQRLQGDVNKSLNTIRSALNAGRTTRGTAQ